jgi:hypothetical protein
MRIIGCDLHARQQAVAMLDTNTGELMEITLTHEGNNVREFYSKLPRPVRVGIEATGSMQWFVNLMEELGIECLVGHPAQIQVRQPLDRCGYVLGTPMWNFGLPYKLKQLIDLVAQRNYLFTYDGKQYGPLLNVEKAVVVYTRGSRYLEGTPIPPSRFDHQATYLNFWLQLVGVRNLRSVIVDNAWNRDRQESEVSLANGKATLERLVEWFLS